MSAHEQRADLFRHAIEWLYERGGDEAVVEAFGDAEDVNQAWERDLEGFKEYLRGRCREALETTRRVVA